MTTTDTKAIRAQMDALAGFTAGPWYTHNQPGDWGLGGAHSIHVADANPYEWDQCIAHVEYQTPYCLGEKPSVLEAARTAACNARLIAAAPDMRETILALCAEVDELRAENERPDVADPLTAAALTLRDAIEGNDRPEMHRLLLAACFGAERFDKMAAATITHDGAPMAMLRDLLTAIIDPSDPALDDLRMINLAETEAAP